MRHVEVQISATIHLPRGYQPTRDIVENAIKFRLEHDRDPHGVTLRIVGWNTTSARGELHERQLDDDDDDTEHWHKFRGLLQAAQFKVWPRWNPEGAHR